MRGARKLCNQTVLTFVAGFLIGAYTLWVTRGIWIRWILETYYR